MSAPAAPTMTQEQQRAGLVAARRRATGLLAVVAALLLATVALPAATATGYLRAMLEASLVGGLADWFAVVALFRHPLGLPIPHTAVIQESKDGLGANLATFVEENFLDEDDLIERLARREHVVSLGTWLADPGNADRLGQQAARLAIGILGGLDRDELVEQVATAVHHRLLDLPLPELAGKALHQAVLENRHQAAVSGVIDGVRQAIVDNRTVLRRRLGEQSPAWVPPVIDDLVFERAEEVVTNFLKQLASDSAHELRASLDEQLLALTMRMQEDPALIARVDEAVASSMTPDLVRDWVAGWGADLDRRLQAALDGDDDRLRAVIAEAIASFGSRLVTDMALQDRVLAGLRSVAPTLAGVGQREITALVASTVDRWDGAETSDRLELWLGRDLQFVRINGTLVGGVVGLVLHAVTRLLGF